VSDEEAGHHDVVIGLAHSQVWMMLHDFNGLLGQWVTHSHTHTHATGLTLLPETSLNVTETEDTHTLQ